MKKAVWAAVLLSAVTARAADTPPMAKALFAGGCFWSMEAAFDDAPGVVKAVAGYAGGTVANPSYEQVSAGNTGHLEVVEVTYDPVKTDYKALLDRFWHHVDPYDAGGQFCDKGPEYRSAIFPLDEAQRQAALASQQSVDGTLGKKTLTEIRPEAVFYPAEEYHQRYTKKNPLQYGFYKTACGRDRRLAEIWESGN